jgi:hypothetical protein
MELVNSEVNDIWKKGKEKHNEKVDWAVHKRTKADSNVKVHKGVFVGNEELDEYEKEAKKNSKTKTKNVYMMVLN